MFELKCQGNASYFRALEDNEFKGKTCKANISKGKACSGKACSGKACNDNACKDNACSGVECKGNACNVREMHVWAEMSGQGIIGQGT
jgi:hypothetical protein